MATFSQYQVGEIVNGSSPPGNLILIPTSWVEVNDRMKFATKYLPLPHTEDDQLLIESFVFKRAYPPPENWNMYEFIPKRDATTYNDALEILNNLKLKSSKLTQKERAKSSKLKSKEILKDVTNSSQIFYIQNNEVVKLLDKIPTNQQLIDCESVNTENEPADLFEMPIVIEDSLTREEASTSAMTSESNAASPMISRSNNVYPIHMTLNSGYAINEQDTDNTKSAKRNNSSKQANSYGSLRSSTDSAPVNKSARVSVDKHSKLKRNSSSVNEDSDENSDNDLIDNTSLTDVKRFMKSQFKTIKKYLKKQDSQMLDMSVNIQELKTLIVEKRKLKEDENIISLNKFCDLHKLVVPFKNVEDFEQFDNELHKKKEMYNHFKAHLISSINTNDTVNAVVTFILRKFFSKDVLNLFTAQKKNNTKRIFKNTSFSTCLQDCLHNCYNDVEKGGEKAYLNAVSITINNSKDWDGARAERGKKKKLSEEENAEDQN